MEVCGKAYKHYLMLDDGIVFYRWGSEFPVTSQQFVEMMGEKFPNLSISESPNESGYYDIWCEIYTPEDFTGIFIPEDCDFDLVRTELQEKYGPSSDICEDDVDETIARALGLG